MPHEQRDSQEEVIKKLVPNEQLAGILKDKEKIDLENQIIDTLKSLNNHLTKKEILALVHRIEVGKWLEGLRSELSKEKHLSNTEISDEALQDILNLFHEIEKVAESDIRELKLELNKLNISKEYTVDSAMYLSSRFPWIKKLEDSKLWENIVIDLAGIWVGALDSVYAIVTFLITLLGDLIMLPKHLMDEVQKK
jgi:hypothetical protein